VVVVVVVVMMMGCVSLWEFSQGIRIGGFRYNRVGVMCQPACATAVMFIINYSCQP